MTSISGDVEKLGYVLPKGDAIIEWDREVAAYKKAQHLDAKGDHFGAAARLVEAVTPDPAYNLYNDEVRAVSTKNPFHITFSQFYGNKSPVEHYGQILSNMSGQHVEWDENRRVFKAKGAVAKLDFLEF